MFLRRSVLLPIHRLRHKDNLSQEVSCSRQRTVLVRNLWQQYSKKEYGTHELTYFHSFIAWVAEAEGKIVSSSGLIFFQKPPSENNLSGLEAYILNMYTLPPWRGQGIATRLLHELMQFIKQTRAHRIWMYATKDGKPIYEKAGFVPKTRHTLEMELLWKESNSEQNEAR